MGKYWAQQAVGVLVRAALPRTAGVAEEDVQPRVPGIRRAALQPRLARGQELVTPLGGPRRRDPQFPWKLVRFRPASTLHPTTSLRKPGASLRESSRRRSVEMSLVLLIDTQFGVLRHLRALVPGQ